MLVVVEGGGMVEGGGREGCKEGSGGRILSEGVIVEARGGGVVHFVGGGGVVGEGVMICMLGVVWDSLGCVAYA